MTDQPLRIIKAIALVMATSFALPALARLARALADREWLGAFFLAMILAGLAIFARWVATAVF